MTHRRKTFIVYPPNYKPGGRVKKAKSLRQGWTAMPAGSSMVERISIHTKKHTECAVTITGRTWGNAPSVAEIAAT